MEGGREGGRFDCTLQLSHSSSSRGPAGGRFLFWFPNKNGAARRPFGRGGRGANPTFGFREWVASGFFRVGWAASVRTRRGDGARALFTLRTKQKATAMIKKRLQHKTRRERRGTRLFYKENERPWRPRRGKREVSREAVSAANTLEGTRRDVLGRWGVWGARTGWRGLEGREEGSVRPHTRTQQKECGNAWVGLGGWKGQKQRNERFSFLPSSAPRPACTPRAKAIIKHQFYVKPKQTQKKRQSNTSSST